MDSLNHWNSNISDQKTGIYSKNQKVRIIKERTNQGQTVSISRFDLKTIQPSMIIIF